MGKVKKFDLEFANAAGAFYAGQSVAGKIHLELNEPTKIVAIKIHFLGEASVSFVEKTTSNKKRSVTDREKYFDQLDVLFGHAEPALTCASSVLPAGRHEFPFVFAAPSHLPSSYEHKMGRVRYECKASLHMPLLTRDHTVKRAFTIVALLDLSRREESLLAITLNTAKQYNSACIIGCARGCISVQVHLERGAFVPGERVLVSAEVVNAAPKRIKAVEAWIQQNITLQTRSGAKKTILGDTRIGRITQGSVAPRSEQNWVKHPLQLPPLPPTDLGGCRLFKIQYVFNFVVTVAGEQPIHLSQPITLGTIPLYQAPASWGTLHHSASVSSAPRRPPPPSCSPQRPYSLSTPSATNQQPAMAPPTNQQTGHVMPSAPPCSDSVPRHATAPVMPHNENVFHFGGMSPAGDAHAPPSYEECVYVDRVDLGLDQNEDHSDNPLTRSYRPLYPTYNQMH